MTTIRDVAKLASVSVATVSRVLNNSGYVNELTRERVNKVINELNYQPNSIARSLYKKETKTVGFIVPDISNPFFPALIRAAEDYLNEQGFTIILCNSDEDVEKEERYLSMMKQKYVDGVLIISDYLTAEQVKEAPMPILALDRTVDDDVPTVLVDNYQGGRTATKHLMEMGCERIAHIRGPEHIENANDRYDGYLNIVRDTDWFDDSYVAQGGYQLNQAKEAATKLLTENPSIDGIFASNDLMALGALKAAERLNFNVPHDVKIIGFDGIEWTKATTPELSTMSQPLYEIGKKAASLLVEIIQGNKIDQKKFIFPLTLEKRKSTER
ncbi:LacI family DNA-binding transcriptional regulator [Halalkalibacillus halophilus]|uniref:LacI family DNA-binding transcriptional regulator n=1 Tax=Halalkalibacillus halophilus TaxID=392827 RepID=UPI000404EDF5|nr:LacI family DNA-binding transcriptional regulator [Halalkalibacillus halophilus]